MRLKSEASVLAPGLPIFLFLLFAVIPNTLTSTLLAPGLPALAQEFGGGPDNIKRAQLLMTVPGLGMLLSPLLGWVADRIGVRRVLIGSLALDACAGLSCLLTQDFALLLVLRFVLGIGVGGLMAVSLSMIGDYYIGEARTKMIGYRWATMCIYSILAVQAAGYLSRSFGWQGPLYIYGVGIPLILFAVLLVRPDRVSKANTAEAAGPVQPLRETFNGTFALAMAGNVFLAICSYNVYAQLPFLMREKGFDPTVYAHAMIPVTLAGMAAALIFIRLRKRMHPLAIIGLALFMAAIGTAGFAAAGTMLTFLAAGLFNGAASAMFEPALSSFLLEKVHPSRRALVMGGIFSTFHIGPFLIPFVFGGINARHGFVTSFYVLAAAAAVGAVLLLISLRGRVLTRPTPAPVASAAG